MIRIKRTRQPIALTIAGSDSGGGAGIQADLKTFAALGVHGTSAITCLTAQNPKGVSGIQAASTAMVRQQIEAVFAELPPDAIKTGMLYSAEIIRVVAALFDRPTPHPSPLPVRRGEGARRIPLVVDPVMVATSGAVLLKPSAIRVLKEELFPLATLITPNLDEANLLLGVSLKSVDDLRWAVRELNQRFGCAALVKGGHLRTGRDAVDVFFDGRCELLLSAPFVKGVSTHGTGCTYSAAIASYLALGRTLPTALRLAKRYITRAIGDSQRTARHFTLGW